MSVSSFLRAAHSRSPKTERFIFGKVKGKESLYDRRSCFRSSNMKTENDRFLFCCRLQVLFDPPRDPRDSKVIRRIRNGQAKIDSEETEMISI